MKKFQYQILHFCPDKVTGEFLNVGIVLFDVEEQKLAFKILHKVGAIGQLFNQANTRYLVKQLGVISKSLQQIGNTLAADRLPLSRYESVDELTRQAFVRDDSALLFSDVRQSLDVSIEHLLAYLGNRMLSIGGMELDQDVKSDKEVWTKMFKKHFDEFDVSTHLTPRTIKTRYDEMSFEHTWKNGSIRFFEPVNFDLQKEDSIKNKVRRWAGQIDELETVGEDIHLYLLANMPAENVQMEKYIAAFLADKSSERISVDIVTLAEVAEFTTSIKREMTESAV